MSSEWELDEGIQSIKSAWRREHTARANLEKMLEQANAENAKLRELLGGVGYLLFALDVDYCVACPRDSNAHPCPVYTVKGGECLYKSDMRELGIEVMK